MDSQNPIFELLNVMHYHNNSKKIYKQSLVFSALSFRLNSESIFKYNGKSIFANTNDISFVPQNLEYSRRASKEELIVFHFNAYGHITSEIKVFSLDGKKYKRLFCDALKIWQEKGTGYRFRATAILYEIFAEMQCDGAFLFSDADDYVMTAVNEIEKNFVNPDFKIEDLSKNVFISEAYLRRKFNEKFAISPKAYLTGRRIQEAEIMLKSKYYTQKEIAQKCGFSDVKYFRYAFKKNTGMTVSEYKAQL